MVKADDSLSRGLSSNPDTVYWMDVSDASYYIQTMKITKIKVAKCSTPKKNIYIKKKVFQGIANSDRTIPKKTFFENFCI